MPGGGYYYGSGFRGGYGYGRGPGFGPGWGPCRWWGPAYAPDYGPSFSGPGEEKAFLEEQVKQLKSELAYLERRMEEISEE